MKSRRPRDLWIPSQWFLGLSVWLPRWPWELCLWCSDRRDCFPRAGLGWALRMDTDGGVECQRRRRAPGVHHEQRLCRRTSRCQRPAQRHLLSFKNRTGAFEKIKGKGSKILLKVKRTLDAASTGVIEWSAMHFLLWSCWILSRLNSTRLNSASHAQEPSKLGVEDGHACVMGRAGLEMVCTAQSWLFRASVLAKHKAVSAHSFQFRPLFFEMGKCS